MQVYELLAFHIVIIYINSTQLRVACLDASHNTICSTFKRYDNDTLHCLIG